VLLSYSSKHFSFVIGAFDSILDEKGSVLCHDKFAVLLHSNGSFVPLGQNQKRIFCFVFILCHQQGLALWVAIFH